MVFYCMVCFVLLLIVVDIKRPVDDISEISSDTTERDRSEISMSESIDTASEDERVKDEEKEEKIEESEEEMESEQEEEEEEEEKEVKEAIERVHVKCPLEEYRATMKKISEEDRSESFELLTDIMSKSPDVTLEKPEDDSSESDDDDKEEKQEEKIVQKKAEYVDMDIDLEKLEQMKEDKVETVETVVVETIEKPPLEQAEAKTTGMEVAAFVKEPESVTESETETEDELGKDGRKVTEYQEEEYMEGEVKVTKKTVSHSSHTSTVVKGTPKITETVTVIHEMAGPESVESTSKGKTIQQFTSTVSGVEAEEKMARMNRFKVEGQAREVIMPEFGGKVKESRVKMMRGDPEVKRLTSKPSTEMDTVNKKVGPDYSDSDDEHEETTALVKVDQVNSRPGAGGDARQRGNDDSDGEEGLEFSIKPELIPWMKDVPGESGDMGIMYETDKTIKTEEMQLLDEVTVETKIMEVKTIKMELSSMGDVSVLETTEVHTDTDMKESRQSREREETIYLHTKADKKPIKDEEKLALTARQEATRPESASSARSESESESEMRSIKRERIPIFPKGAKLSDSPGPMRPDIVQTVSQPKETKEEPVTKHTPIEHREGSSDEEPYICVAISSYDPESDEVLSLHEGEKVEILDDSQDDWWLIRKPQSNREGWVPGQYLRDKTVYDRIVERQLKKAIDQLPSATSKGTFAYTIFTLIL